MIALIRCYLCSLKIIGATKQRRVGEHFSKLMHSFSLIIIDSFNAIWKVPLAFRDNFDWGNFRSTQYTDISCEMLRHTDLRISSFSCFATELKKMRHLTLYSLFRSTHDLPIISKLVFVLFSKLFLLHSRKDASLQNASALNCGVEFMHSSGLFLTFEPIE